jgi:hypothetical protein
MINSTVNEIVDVIVVEYRRNLNKIRPSRNGHEYPLALNFCI